MKFNGWEEPKPIPDMLISKNEVLMLIANYQMGTDPHSEIGDAQYSILEMLFRSVQSLTADRKTEPQYDAEEVAKDINRRVAMGQRLETMSCQECKYWKYIAKEWRCSVEKCQYEPQTDCSWK